MQALEFLNGGLLRLSWLELVLATLAMTHITIAAVTIYLHRSQAHRALDLHPIISHFFRLWLWLSTGMQTRDWVAVHRKHHAKCESADDPHSPQVKGLRTVLWRGAELYMAEKVNEETIDRYGHGTPDDWMERRLYSRWTWQGCGAMLIADVVLFGAAGLAVWGVQMMWIPVFAAGVVNGIGHFWGYRNFDVADASANIVPWGVLIGGEELHNNHHTYPTSAKLSARWYEFDLGWCYIRTLQWLRLAKVLRLAPVPRLAGARHVVDLQTLQALVSNRYDLLSRYARATRKTLSDELARLRLSSRLSAHDYDRFAGLKTWVARRSAAVPEMHRKTLAELMGHSGVIKTLIEMRDELASIWQHAASSRDEMLGRLQGWVARAEASGIRALMDAAARIRSYAPAPAAS
ncbi:MAG: fatty acid desaturase [Burkholderiaceae bacterium]|nr:fatty acid desaturase [Burkholderiaceae bacterium]